MWRTVLHNKMLRKIQANILQVITSKYYLSLRCIQLIWSGEMRQNQVKFMNCWKLSRKKCVLMNYTCALAMKNQLTSSEVWSATSVPITSPFSAESSLNSTIKKLISTIKKETWIRWTKKCRQVKNGLNSMMIEWHQLRKTGSGSSSNVLNRHVIRLCCFMKS